MAELDGKLLFHRRGVVPHTSGVLEKKIRPLSSSRDVQVCLDVLMRKQAQCLSIFRDIADPLSDCVARRPNPDLAIIDRHFARFDLVQSKQAPDQDGPTRPRQPGES